MELPQDFKERMKRQLGDSYKEFLEVYEKERVCGLRCNPLKTEPEKLKSLLLKQGIALEQVSWAGEGFYYPPDTQPGRLALHEAGAYYIQEPSAMAAAALLEPGPGEKILDLCAAPGGKSTQIAGRMAGSGLLVSNETVSKRAKILSGNIERMGIVNAVVLNETPEHLAECFPQFFDRILADAPCSGEGMFRKDETAREQWSLENTLLCAKRQRSILTQAVRMLKPGGILVYSTCTFAPVENEENVQWLTEEYPELIPEYSGYIWPHLKRGEGHYMARFRKEGAECNEKKEKRFVSGRKQRTGSRSSMELKEGMQMLEQFCRETLSEQVAVQISDRIQSGQLAAFGNQLYLLPPGIESLDGLKTERAGLQLGCVKKNRFEPAHALAMALRPQDMKQALELEEPQRYIRGETISSSAQKGWVLMTVEGCSIGWGKASKGMIKNHYPKGLRRECRG